MPVLAVPGFQLQPSAEQIALSTNYLTNFDFLNQYLPDTYEKEFERYGNRSVASFLRMVGAEIPSASDQIKWAEQGRLHIKYNDVNADDVAAGDTSSFTLNGVVANMALRPGQTVIITDNATGLGNNALILTVDTALQNFTVAFYEAGGQAMAQNSTCSVFIYGSEFRKGTVGMVGSLEAEDEIFDNKPIILKDRYAVNGSDMAQIGWIEVTTENGASGFLWYLKSEHETRLRFEDYLETSMLEAVPAEAGSGVVNPAINTTFGNMGSEGVFFVVNTRGNVWGAGNPTTLADFDTIVARLDRQGAIEENAIFVNRDFSFDIDDMLAQLNGYVSGGSSNSASFGLFDNDVTMALNLGFSGFRRGYDFYKSEWRYLNDPTMRGNMTGNAAAVTTANAINGLLVPAGSTTVYDQILGKNAKRPFLHVRYRASETENRKMKTWITGSAGGAQTSDLDAMEVNFLSERCICTLGANNFFLFRFGA